MLAISKKTHIASDLVVSPTGLLHHDEAHSVFKAGRHKHYMKQPEQQPSGEVDGQTVQFRFRPNEIKGPVDNIKLVVAVAAREGTGVVIPAPLTRMIDEMTVATVGDNPLEIRFGMPEFLEYCLLTDNPMQNTELSRVDKFGVVVNTTMAVDTDLYLVMDLERSLIERIPFSMLKQEVLFTIKFQPNSNVQRGATLSTELHWNEFNAVQLHIQYDSDTVKHTHTNDILYKSVQAIPYISYRKYQTSFTPATVNSDYSFDIPAYLNGKCAWMFIHIHAATADWDDFWNTANSSTASGAILGMTSSTEIDIKDENSHSILGGPRKIIQNNLTSQPTGHGNNYFRQGQTAWYISFCDDMVRAAHGEINGYHTFDQRHTISLTGVQWHSTSTKQVNIWFAEYREVHLDHSTDTIKRLM